MVVAVLVERVTSGHRLATAVDETARVGSSREGFTDQEWWGRRGVDMRNEIEPS
jgi:hypothetical protein